MSKLPSGPFGCILADPPWRFNPWSNSKNRTRGAENHYRTIPLETLAAMPVQEVAGKDCALFVWVVDSHLDDALRLGTAWGFEFKTCAFVWIKSRGEGVIPRPGMGHWTRKQAEQCWLFTRGKPRRLSKGVEQALFCGRGQHSAKPDEQYERIEALVGGPYLEMFSRLSRPGWVAWGDQAGLRDTLFEYSAYRDGIESYYAAIAAKKARGDSGGW